MLLTTKYTPSDGERGGGGVVRGKKYAIKERSLIDWARARGKQTRTVQAFDDVRPRPRPRTSITLQLRRGAITSPRIAPPALVTGPDSIKLSLMDQPDTQLIQLRHPIVVLIKQLIVTSTSACCPSR